MQEWLKFECEEDRLSVYGRFGVIPAWLLQ